MLSDLQLRERPKGTGAKKENVVPSSFLDMLSTTPSKRAKLTGGKRNMMPLNAVFFFLSCGEVAFWSFIVVFFKHVGYSKKQIGVLFSAREFAGLFGALIWGPLADYFGSAVVMFFGMIAAMLLCTSMVFESVQSDFALFTLIFALSSFCVTSHSLLDAICVKILMTSDNCTSQRTQHTTREQRSSKEPDKKITGNKKNDSTDSYGETRWYYSFGFGVMSILLALSVEAFGPSLVFFCFDGFTVFGLVILWHYYIKKVDTTSIGDVYSKTGSHLKRPSHGEFKKVPNESDSESEGSTQRTPKPLLVTPKMRSAKLSMSRTEVWKAVGTRMWRLDAIIYATNIFVYGCLKSLLDNFVFLTVLDSMNGTILLCGIGNAVMVGLGEIPPFLKGEYLLKRFGITNLFTLAMSSYVVCTLGYTVTLLIHHRSEAGNWQWLVLFCEPFHGANFSLMWIAAIAFCARTGPRQVQATTQGVLRFILSRVAGTVGAILGAAAVESYGFLTLWSGALVIGSVWTVIFYFVSGLIEEDSEAKGKPPRHIPKNT